MKSVRFVGAVSLLAADRISFASPVSTLKEIRLVFFMALSQPILVAMGEKTDSPWGPKILLPESWNCLLSPRRT